MPDTDVQVAPSATTSEAPASQPETQVNDNPHSYTSAEKAEWRKSGKMPLKAKPEPKPNIAESAPAQVQEQEPSEALADETDESESAAVSETAPEQEPGRPQKRSDAQTRIRELLAENKRLKAERLTQQATPTPAASSPAKPAEQFTRPEPKLEDKNSDGSAKYASYEDYIKDLGKWSAEQQIASSERNRTLAEQRSKLDKEISEARKQYPDFDDHFVPVLRQITDDQSIHMAVKQVINDSEVLPHLLYVMGTDADDLADTLHLARTNPLKAIKKIAALENLIQEELQGEPAETPRDDKGQFTSSVPEKKETSAPPPPRQVGGRQAPPPDEVESATEKNDFRSFKNAANRRDLERAKR